MNKIFFINLILVFAFMTACEKETNHSVLMPGFWAQEAILEDGAQMNLSECEQSIRLLIEKNGIYRLYSSCDTMERYGTWIVTNETMLDMSLDHWNGSNKYEPYPVRFSIVKITGNELEIRIKTFIGDRKKLVMFTPVEQDIQTGKTDDELLELDRINKTFKTYVYRFSKQD